MKRRLEEAPAAGANEDERFPWEKEPSRYIDGALAVKLKFVASLDDAAQVSALPFLVQTRTGCFQSSAKSQRNK